MTNWPAFFLRQAVQQDREIQAALAAEPTPPPERECGVMDEHSTRTLNWFLSTTLPPVPFEPAEMTLIWNRQDLWARHPETKRWWYLAIDRPVTEWSESTKTCLRRDLL